MKTESCDLIIAGMKIDIWVSLVALIVSILSLLVAIRYASKTFRPIVAAMVKTYSGGNISIIFNLVVLNSGTIPAREIKLRAKQVDLNLALGKDSDEANRSRWLACFADKCTIPVLLNGERVSCSFGLSQNEDAGFWKYNAEIPITIEYKGWFGKTYCEKHTLYIRDSESFTGAMWS